MDMGRMPSERAAALGPSRYGIAAVERTLDVVEALVRLGPATLSHLAQQADCSRVNAFRILRTLQSRGLAIQNGKRGAWQLGGAWLAVARAADRQGVMATTAGPVMAQLAESTGDSVYLMLRDGQECLVVAVRPGAVATHLFLRPGDRAPLYAGPGQLLLAFAPEPAATSRACRPRGAAKPRRPARSGCAHRIVGPDPQARLADHHARHCRGRGVRSVARCATQAER